MELDHDLRDVDGVFDHYDAELRNAGFVQNDLERDDGRTQIDLDADDLGPATELEPFTARTCGPLEFEFHDAEIVEIEWDFEVDYDGESTTVEKAYEHYHAMLTDLGWTRTEGATEWDEIEADYFARDGVELELEVELDDGDVQVEIELDEDRFYA